MNNIVFNIPNPYPTNRYVFVYGTLRRGEANDITKLKPAPRYVGDTQINGKMYHLGGYPGIILDTTLDTNFESVNIIVGEVYEITESLERVLDGIESEYPAQADEYYKRDIKIVVNGVTLDCIVYEINSAYIQGKKLIASGDWVKDR